MNTLQRMLKKRTAAGSAAVEFAFILPLLVLLALPVFDFARVIQANIILINLSREGANLASRSSQTPQTIMNAIAATAPPLNMGSRGMIYITKVMGNKEGNSIRNVIVQQHKWLAGGTAQDSTLWPCGGWNGDGSCYSVPTNPSAAPTANVMTGQLADGEVVYVVEGFYNAGNMLFSAMNLGFGITTPQLSPNLHAMTIF